MYALAVLQLVITLGWMAYAHFQTPLLEAFGFGSLVGFVGLYLTIVGATLAPLVGGLGDRIAGRGGDRFSLVVVGGLVAGATFVAVAATNVVTLEGPLRFVLLGLVLVWIAAMTVLQAPALSLLPRIATSTRWPAVMPPLVIATVLPNALWPFVLIGFEALGGPATFLAGGIAVLGATLLLRGAMREALPRTPHDEHGPASVAPMTSRAAWPTFGLLFAVGVASAFVTRLASDLAPTMLAASVGAANQTAPLFAATTLGAGVIFARRLGSLGAVLGAQKSVVASTAAALACALFAPLCSTLLAALAVAVTLGAALALHLDSALPFSLAALEHRRAGLASGLYLGGIFAGSHLAATLLTTPPPP